MNVLLPTENYFRIQIVSLKKHERNILINISMQFLFVECILSHYWVKYKIEYLPAESATDFFVL